MKGYYFITDSTLSKNGDQKDIKTAVWAGVDMIQFRDKSCSLRNFYRRAQKFRLLCKTSKFIINDRVDVALAVDADGVHIGQNDLPLTVVRRILGKKKIIGVTANTLKQALLAEKMGADYIGISPVFATLTKPDAGNPCGTDLIKKVKSACSLPLAAIGGITYDNAREVIEAGADMICAISAVVAAANPLTEIRKFQELFYDTT